MGGSGAVRPASGAVAGAGSRPDGAPSFVVRGGRIVLPDGIVDGDLVVEDGRIARVAGEPGERGERDREHERALPVVDATGRFVLAGMIDTHVHLRDPGHPHRETFATGTRSAALGGVTTVLEMPSGIPAVSDAASWRYKLDVVAPKAHVDFALYGGAGERNLDRIQEQADAGAVAFKSFMTRPAPDADPGLWTRSLPDDGPFLEAMRIIARTGRVAVVHAESDSICACMTARARERSLTGLRAHAAARPPIAEEEAVARAILLAGDAGARLSIAHLSTARAVERVRRAKAEGQAVTAEVCPHHLLRTTPEAERLGPYAKFNPPLREREDAEALWHGLEDGTIDFVGTDHAPYTAEDKEPGWADIHRAPSGAHGLETVLPVLLSEVDRGRITLPALTRIVSRNAARVFGLERKGELRVGADADLAIVELGRPGTVDRDRLQSASRDGARLWDGYPVTAAVTATFVRGRLVARDGEVVGAAGEGRLVVPGAGAAAATAPGASPASASAVSPSASGSAPGARASAGSSAGAPDGAAS